MSDANWDDEDFQPALPSVAKKIVDKWDGEDEEEEVKDSWEDFGEEEKKESGDAPTETKASLAEKKKKKKLADILAEKERKKQEEKEQKKHADAEEPDRPLTEAERIALEEERDLEIAKETFGVKEEASGIWSGPLKTEQDLKTFREALVEKLEKQKAPVSAYVTFLEDFLRDICVPLDTDDVKKLSATVNAIHNEKVNASKVGKAKKGKGKRANLNPGAKNVQDDDAAYYGTGYDDYEDFI